MNIIQYPDPILTTKCTKIPSYDDETRDKVREMIKLMHGHGGIGLAAPQVGWSARCFVVDMKGKNEVFIDPFIVTKSGGTIADTEGCISIPYLMAKVLRAKRVEIAYSDVDGNEKTLKVTDPLIARVIQHEYDHLDGILFYTKAIESERKRVIGVMDMLKRRREMGVGS